jgi:hypothetical protein
LQLGNQFGSMLLRPVGKIDNRRLAGGQASRHNRQQIGPGKHLTLFAPVPDLWDILRPASRQARLALL